MAQPPLVVNRVPGEGHVVLRLVGEVDSATAAILADAIAAAALLDPAAIELDCTEMTFLESSGVSVIMEARQRFADHPQPLPFWLTNLNPPARRLLEMIGVLPLVDGPQPGS